MSIGIEGVNAVVLSSNVEDVECPQSRDRNIRRVQWLGINLAVHPVGKPLPEPR
jgi:hypothetical protein